MCEAKKILGTVILEINQLEIYTRVKVATSTKSYIGSICKMSSQWVLHYLAIYLLSSNLSTQSIEEIDGMANDPYSSIIIC